MKAKIKFVKDPVEIKTIESNWLIAKKDVSVFGYGYLIFPTDIEYLLIKNIKIDFEKLIALIKFSFDFPIDVETQEKNILNLLK